MHPYKKLIYSKRTAPIDVPASYCATWEAHNLSNIKMSLDGYIDFTEMLGTKNIDTTPGLSVGTITGYYIAGAPTTLVPCSVAMTFTTKKGNFSTDSLPVVTDKVLSSIVFQVEIITTPYSEISMSDIRLDGIVTGVGQIDSEYNSCV